MKSVIILVMPKWYKEGSSPILIKPLSQVEYLCINSCADCTSSIIFLALLRNSCPARDKYMLRLFLTNKCTPSSFSSVAICCDSVDCEILISNAAVEKDLYFSTAKKYSI